MLEVVFSRSAYGSRRVAQSYGVGPYRSGTAVAFVEGDQLTEEELHAAQMQAEERARRDWENAVSLGSERNDIYYFDLALSVGEITETEPGEQRRAALKELASVWPREDLEQELEEELQNARQDLASVLARCAEGEDVRVWYSHNPDEMCGMHWLMAQLHPLKQRGTVYLIQIPAWNDQEDTTVRTYQGCGELGPGEWGKYLSLQREGKPALVEACAQRWRELQKENAPLRIYLNGRLQSAPEEVYDSYILRELKAQEREFVEARAIGMILGKYQLGIGDGWIAQRIEQFVKEGLFEVLTPADPDGPTYRRTLRKKM